MMKKILLTFCLLNLCVFLHAQDDRLRVAVLDPTTSGISIDDGTKLAVQELISSTFVNTGKYIIIERSMIDKIIKEQSFQNSDMADNSQATEIGKLAGANKVVLSAVSMVGGRNMLSIKIIDVMTASIDKQKTKIVSSNDLLDAVEPLTLEMLGEEAVYVKQNTVFSQQNTPAPQPAPSQTRSVSKSNAASSTSSENPNFDYGKENSLICKQIDDGIEIVKHTPNPSLEKKLAKGSLQTQVMIGSNITATLTAPGILTIEGTGEIISNPLFEKQLGDAVAIIVGEGITKIGTFKNGSHVQYIKLPNSLEFIGDECFSGLSNLLAVNIPQNVKSIGKSAFYKCKTMPYIVIPSGVENIGPKAFCGCKELKSITLPNALTVIPEELLSGCKNLSELYFSNNVSSIGKEAFSDCEKVQKLHISNTVMSIGDGCFKGMSSLYEISLSESIKVIPDEAFADCRSLTKVICPESVTRVGKSAFENCENLFQVVFRAEFMAELGENCLSDCKSLGSIVLYSLKPPICKKEIFDDDYREKVTLSVHPSAIGLYKDAKYWDDFDNIVPISQ